MSVLFDRLLDDAAIFPPGNAPLADAVRDHREVMDSPLGRHVGPFVCSATRLPALGDMLTDDDVLDIALVTAAGAAGQAIGAVHDDPRMRLRAVEMSDLPVGEPVPAVPQDTLLIVERPVEPPFDLPEGAAVKLRTGGETADAFPDAARLAHAIRHVVEENLRFKLTAGLHHAVRHTDPETGFEHHGFLNVMLAVHAAAIGEGVSERLAERDASVVAKSVAELDESARGLVRSHFLSFGTCSITDPIDDLRRLGLLEHAA